MSTLTPISSVSAAICTCSHSTPIGSTSRAQKARMPSSLPPPSPSAAGEEASMKGRNRSECCFREPVTPSQASLVG